jgi:transcriptional regulator with XRE-family HTH domain
MTTDDLVATLASNVRRLMDEKGLTQTSLAALTDGAISQKTISNICAGKGIQLQHLEPLAKALQTEAWRLLVSPHADSVRLLEAFSAADPAGRELIKQLVERELTISEKR